MGTNCCTITSREQHDLDTDVCGTEPSQETNSPLSNGTHTANDVKTMIIHESKGTRSVKSHMSCEIAPNILINEPPPTIAGPHLIPEEAKEKLGLIEMGTTTIKPAFSILRCPTNFKIEPLHFRGERKKESLANRYVVEDIIGRGSFGEVKRIRDKVTGLYRALKVINKDNCQKTDSFADEIEIIKKLVSIF